MLNIITNLIYSNCFLISIINIYLRYILITPLPSRIILYLYTNINIIIVLIYHQYQYISTCDKNEIDLSTFIYMLV